MAPQAHAMVPLSQAQFIPAPPAAAAAPIVNFPPAPPPQAYQLAGPAAAAAVPVQFPPPAVSHHLIFLEDFFISIYNLSQ